MSGPYELARTRTEYRLRDGSTCVIEAHGQRSATVSREVDGRCVWGQVFSHPYPEEHAKQIAKVAESMRLHPDAFSRRDLWDEAGRAVRP